MFFQSTPNKGDLKMVTFFTQSSCHFKWCSSMETGKYISHDFIQIFSWLFPCESIIFSFLMVVRRRKRDMVCIFLPKFFHFLHHLSSCYWKQKKRDREYAENALRKKRKTSLKVFDLGRKTSLGGQEALKMLNEYFTIWHFRLWCLLL